MDIIYLQLIIGLLLVKIKIKPPLALESSMSYDYSDSLQSGQSSILYVCAYLL